MKYYCIIILFILLFLVYFYRYPEYSSPGFSNKVYSPSYGRIMKITQKDNQIFIAIFLSPFDVHYQYYPVSGQIIDKYYDPTGKFELAYELNKSNNNEKSITTIENYYGQFKIYQIAGFLTRNIDTYGNIGELVDTNNTMGRIHFGSRVDIIIPNASKFKLQVRENQKMYGPETILGYFS